jgi:hypothetical protein
MARKRKNNGRSKRIPLIGGIVALVGSAAYAVRRRRHGQTAS